MKPLPIRLQCSPGEFSDTPGQHEHDAESILNYAAEHDVDVVGGTEAGGRPGNNLRAALQWFAPRYGFRLFSQPQGDWLAVSRTFGHVDRASFDLVVPAKGGKGGHSGRGIWSVTIKPHNTRYGPAVHVGTSHWLTDRSDPSGAQNELLDHEIGQWAADVGSGSDLVFYMGDTNNDDQRVDVFGGAPLTTCWDELGRWPTTHPHAGGRGPTIDVVASFDRDRRVSCRTARALSDRDLKLFGDHYSVTAVYAVMPRAL